MQRKWALGGPIVTAFEISRLAQDGEGRADKHGLRTAAFVPMSAIL